MVAEFPIVLLVEDSADDVRIALRALSRLDPPVRVELARDGLEALELLGLEGGAPRFEPALVVCDLKMPRMRGDEALRRVRADARLGSTPFVVFSSSDEPSDLETCGALGASEYAVKPVDFGEYGERLRDLVRRHLPTRSEAGAL